ncbi:MAG: glucose 1-dehydrogenase [Dehalococcoidia bacterium]
MRLKDKVALITGGNSGMGKAAAILFAQEGAQVVIAARNEASGRETVKRIVEGGGEAIFVRTDVSRTADVKNVIDTTVRTYGKLNILFNNAGIFYNAHLLEESEEEWNETIDINLKGVFLCTKYAIPEMIKVGGGSIINNASVWSTVVGSELTSASYQASKGGVIALTKNTAVIYAKENIRVNSIIGGSIATPMSGIPEDQLDNPEYTKLVEGFALLPRIGYPKDIAYAALYLASDESAFVTGSSLVVDGGETAV